MDNQELYTRKNTEYYSFMRDDIISLIPPETQRLLDVGCGNGVTGFTAKQLFGIKEIVGIEIYKPAAEIAKTKLDKVIFGDVERVKLNFPECYFDCIICADVLEHTRDPWQVLKKLHFYLRDDGVLIASIPNLRHIVPILKIVFNRFEYEESGIMDKTHLRFFTLHTIENIFKNTGYHIMQISTRCSNSWKFKLLNFCSLGIMRPFSISEYLLIVKKN